MDKKYVFRSIEEKWQDKDKFINSDKSKYILEMFMYPSGKVHMGHCRNFTIVDVNVRYSTLMGYKVFCPIGWDAFGLPAENAAIDNNIHPRIWTEKNIDAMRNTLKKMNYMYNWENEMKTCDSDYIKFQQELFLDFYRNGLVTKKEEWVNWDPIDKTVLANEQVENGIAWRSGATIEKKRISQWFFKTTKYVDELLEGLNDIDWPEPIKNAQRNWIGKQKGYHIDFEHNGEKLTVYTTRPETVYGCTFLVISPESEFAYKIAPEQTKKYLLKPDSLVQIGEAINPYTKQKIPIFLADYVLAGYGTGIVMGVPAHDERDKMFAEKYGLESIKVIDDEDKLINSQDWNGLKMEEVRSKFQQVTCYRLRDWIISRQRYWGCPIPIIYCENCGEVEASTPILLPDDVKFGHGNPLDISGWKHVLCPKCKSPAKRETDTMDTFVDSSWYFLRFPCSKNQDKVFVDAKPVDLYIGGAEHAVLHLLYARFFTKALRDLGYLNFDEPFLKLLNQGMVCLPTYRGKISRKYYYPNQCIKESDKIIGIINGIEEEVEKGPYTKMSKSLLNIIDPEEMLEVFGSDAVRLFIISDSPVNQLFLWNTNGLLGCKKFLNRIWSFEPKYGEYNIEYDQQIKNMLANINIHLENNELNLFAADLRIYFDYIKNNVASKEQIDFAFRYFLKSLWIICPAISNELYNYNDLITDNWYKDQTIITPQEIILSINGKKIQMYKYSNSENLVEIARSILNLPENTKYIYKEGKIINFIQ